MTALVQLCISAVDFALLHSVRAAFLILITGGLVWTLRLKPARIQLSVWTTLLYGLCLMPLLVLFLPTLPIQVPSATISVVLPMEPAGFRLKSPEVVTTTSTELTPFRGRGAVSTKPELTWSGVACLIYALVSLSLLIRLPIGAILGRRLQRVSLVIQANELGVGPGSTSSHLHRPICFAESGRVRVPVTIGWLRPAILLPEDWRSWSTDVRHMILTHELAHIARLDYLHQTISMIYRAIFWINPAAWWLHRHLAELCELASDEAALQDGNDPTRYAELVLSFSALARNKTGRVETAGIAMARVSQIGRRLEKILEFDVRHPLVGSRWSAYTAIGLMTGILACAASLRPASSAQIVLPRVQAQLTTEPFSTSYVRTVTEAQNASKADIRALEESVRQNPGDIEVRSKLVVVYASPLIDQSTLGKQRFENLYWLVVNRPDAEILGSPFAVLPPTADSSDRRVLEGAFLAATEADRTNARLAWNAARLFAGYDFAQYQRLLERAVELEPRNQQWSTELGILYAEAIVASHRSSSPSSGVLAANARRQLGLTSNSTILSAAIHVLNASASKAAAVNESGEDPLFVEQLIKRVRELGGDGSLWVSPPDQPTSIDLLSPQNPAAMSTPVAIRLQDPANFSSLPDSIRALLTSEGCRIPQPPSPDGDSSELRNAITGQFRKRGETDWAVLCRYTNQMESILLFWNGDASQREVAVTQPAHSRGCWTEIRPVGEEVIMRHYRTYGGPKPPPIRHDAIDAGICEKASITHYRHEGNWLKLQGAD